MTSLGRLTSLGPLGPSRIAAFWAPPIPLEHSQRPFGRRLFPIEPQRPFRRRLFPLSLSGLLDTPLSQGFRGFLGAACSDRMFTKVF